MPAHAGNMHVLFTKRPDITLEILEKYPFSKTNDTLDPLRENSAKIIDDCQKIISLTNDQQTKKRFEQIIALIAELTALAAEQSVENKAKVLQTCRKLQTTRLQIPTKISTPDDFSTTNYKVAVVCFHILLLSVSLTLGAAFGALYFGFLTATYFADCLAIALSVIGIPALTLGATAYSAYKAYKNPVAEMFDEVKQNIDSFCQQLGAIQEELEPMDLPTVHLDDDIEVEDDVYVDGLNPIQYGVM